MVGGIAGSNLGTIQGCTADDIRINSKTKNNTAQIERIYNLGAKCLINQGYYRYYCIGGLVGNNQGTLTECEVVTDAIIYGFQSVGGFVGYNSGSVTKCWFGVPDSVKDIPYYEVYNYPSNSNPQYTLSAEDTHWDIGENEAGATAENLYGVTADPDHVHSFSTWTVVKEATCTEDGLKTSTCDICGAKASEVIPAKGHVDKNNDKKCDNCGADVDCHSHVDADDNGFCDDCGENICEHASTTTVGAKDATCEEAGYTGDKVCDKCGATIEKGTEIPATGHVDKNNNKKCDNCGADVDCHEHVDADDNGFCDDCGENVCKHTESTVINAKDATCEEAGYTGDTVCTKCGNVIEKGSVIDALGHSDKDNDKKYDNCGADVDCHEHFDADKDGVCDGCHAQITDNCLCHRNNIFSKILRLVCSILSIVCMKRIACCSDMEYLIGDIGDWI